MSCVDVVVGQHHVVGHDAHAGVQGMDGGGGGRHLGLAEAVDRVDDLALEVRLVDHVEVDDADRADPGGRQVEQAGGAKTAGPDEQDARLEQLGLAADAHLGDQEVAAVALLLRRREGDGRLDGRPSWRQASMPPAIEATSS